MKTLRSLTVTLSILLCLACSPAQITLSLRLALSAAQSALSTIQGPDGQALPGAAQASAYIAEATTAISEVGSILSGSGTNSSKAAGVSAALASIVAADPHLPAGTPRTIVTAIATLSTALQGVLTTYGQALPPPASKGLTAARPSAPDLQQARGQFAAIAAEAKTTAARARK